MYIKSVPKAYKSIVEQAKAAGDRHGLSIGVKFFSRLPHEEPHIVAVICFDFAAVEMSHMSATTEETISHIQEAYRGLINIYKDAK